MQYQNHILQVKFKDLPDNSEKWISIKSFKDLDNTFTVCTTGNLKATSENIGKAKAMHPEYQYRAVMDHLGVLSDPVEV